MFVRAFYKHEFYVNFFRTKNVDNIGIFVRAFT